MKKAARVTGKMTIEEIIQNFPETLSVFLKYGLHCVGCPMSTPETVEEAAKTHQIEIKKFIKELNEAVKR